MAKILSENVKMHFKADVDFFSLPLSAVLVRVFLVFLYYPQK